MKPFILAGIGGLLQERAKVLKKPNWEMEES